MRALVALAVIVATLRADEPPKLDLRPTLEFHDLMPHDAEGGKGKEGEKYTHTTCGREEPAHGGLFASAEYLLLRPRRAAFDFALTDPNRDLAPTGKVQSLNYELRSGVRVGLGYAFDHWTAGFEYTYLGSGADRSLSAPAGGTLYATLTRPGLNDDVNTAQASAGLVYNLFDATARRSFEIDHHTRASVYGGFRFATLRQDFHALYNGGDANFGNVDTSSNFDGFGPLVGGDFAWSLHEGFHLYAKGSAALMTGTLRNTLNETNNARQTVYADLDYTTRRVIPVTTLGLGGGWQRENVTLRVGYEITNWFGLIDTPRFNGELAEGKYTTRNGDFSLEGIFVQFSVQY